LVFIGNKATVLDSGVWAFVTDSTGKKLLWEKQYNLPGVDAGGNPLTTVTPLSVCATPDGGFTMVGDNNTYQNNHNAFAMHFVSKPISAVMYRGNFQAKSLNGFSVRLAGAKLLVSNTMSKIPATVSLFDVLGRCVVNATSPRPMATPLPQERGEDKFGTIQLDISHLAHGMYVVRVKAGMVQQAQKIVKEY
jgi:hypothetical protein